jgi:uncharacterized protein YktA (UPF0223 family)
MKEYEILLIIISLSLTGVAFKITIEELNVFKVFKLKHFKIIFKGKTNYKLVTKTYNSLSYYHNYQLPKTYDN